MENWKIFENECVEYLNKTYGDSASFQGKGGSDSTAPDIKVYDKRGKHIFSIEAKMPNAQAGQFVLFPKDGKFEYSDRNAHEENEQTTAIIKQMNDDFDRYNAPGTRGVNLCMSSSLLYDWVKEYYQNVKNEKYFITKNNSDFIIFPVDKLDQYLNVSAMYRKKGSGSSVPSNNNKKEIENTLKASSYTYSDIEIGKVESTIILKNCTKDRFILQGQSYRYQFKKINGKQYQIRRLSNTSNANVIFSISVKGTRKEEDLKTFEDDL